MCKARHLLSSLGSLVVAAMLGATTAANGASAYSGSEPNTSAIAQLQQTLISTTTTLGPRKVSQSTAFVIDNGNDAAPALLLSSGHAVLDTFNEVREGLVGTGHVSFDRLAGETFPVAQVRYVSRRGLDFAILELQLTQAELKAKGIAPLALAGRKAADGEVVTLAARLSGVMHGAASWPVQLLPVFDMRTGAGVLFRHLFEVSGAKVQNGDSGSPVVDASHAVLGILHSGVSGNAQASDLSFVSACLHEGRFGAEAPGCGLGNVFNIQVTKGVDPNRVFTGDNPLIYKQADESPVRIDASVFSSTWFYQAKLAQWPEQCEEPSGYSAPITSTVVANLSEAGLSTAGLVLSSSNPTVLALCIWGTGDDGPEPANRNAVALPVVIHPPGPAAQPQLEFTAPFENVFGRKTQLLQVTSRDLLFQRVEYKLGPWQSADCALAQNYREVPGRVMTVAISRDSRLCVVGVDHAGQRSAPTEVRLQP